MKIPVSASITLCLALMVFVISRAHSQDKSPPDILSVHAEVTGVLPPYPFMKKKYNGSQLFVKITLTNQTDSVLTLWSNTCYWGRSWVFDSEKFYFNDWGCDSNSDIQIDVAPGKSALFYGLVDSKLPLNTSTSFRIGYAILSRKEWLSLFMHDLTKEELLKTKKIYWSNPLVNNFMNNTFVIEH